MPKNEKRGGGRAPKNFDPSYARGGRSAGHGASSQKPGSRSAGHRGFRQEDADASSKKPRWSAEERTARGHSEDRRSAGFGTPRDERAPRRFDNERPARSFDRNERPARRFEGDRNERPARSFDRDDRAPRSFNRDDRPARGFNRDERPARSFNRDDRPARSFDRDARSDRPARSFDRDARPARDGDDRGARGPRREIDRSRDSDRSGRPFREERPSRFDRSDRGDRPDRAVRSYDRDDRAPRSSNRDDRPARSFDRDDRAPRSFNRDERPARSFNRDDRPARSFNRDERPARSFNRDDRPARSFDREERPVRRESDFYGAKPQRSFTDQDDAVLERLQADATEAKDVEGVTFESLGLGSGIVRALEVLGAARPFPIQAATIPDVLAGKDVLGRGRTGSGKTIAFAAPAVERLMRTGSEEIAEGKRTKRQMGRAPRALIMAPTRELALQIDRTVQPIARSVGLFTTQIYGGVPQRSQVMALDRGVDIVIGTPGRIEDLLEQGRLDLSQVTVTVLDEADHMCDLGFLEPVQRILRQTKDGGQKLLFSATLDTGVANLVDEFLVEPAVHEVAGEDQASGTIEHRVFMIDHREKIEVIEQIADRDGKTLIFARTRAYAEQLAEGLEDAGIPAVALHGDLNQSRRTRNLEKLTSGRVRVLVATDVAARGIHVDDIDVVVQADAPDEYKTYLHRSGRTGRAGKRGVVITLASRNRTRKVESLLERAEIQAEWTEVRPGDQLISDVVDGASAPVADAVDGAAGAE